MRNVGCQKSKTLQLLSRTHSSNPFFEATSLTSRGFCPGFPVP